MPDPSTLLDATTADPDLPARAVARALDVHSSAVDRALRRFAPVVETLRHVKRDEFTAAWQQVGVKALERMDQLLDGDPEALKTVPQKGSIGGELRNYAVAAGIASEKALLFAGQPTQIVAQTHDHRLALPDLIARVGRVLQARMGEIGPGGGTHEAVDVTATRIIDDSDAGGRR